MTAAIPTVDQDPGPVRTGALVKLASPTSDAVLHFTTDGTTPTCASGKVYAGDVVVASELTLKAIACKATYSDSQVLSLAFSVRLPVTRYISSLGSDANDVLHRALHGHTCQGRPDALLAAKIWAPWWEATSIFQKG